MSPYEKIVSIAALLVLCGWLFSYWLDEELAARKEAHRWPYD